MTEKIIEYHCCDTCEYKFPVPTDPNFRKWELACSRKRGEVNPSGGLTRCPIWKSNI